MAQTGCILGVHILKEWHEHNENKKRRWGTHPILANRLSTGQFYIMFENHRMYPDKFQHYYRMSVSSFDELKSLVCEKIRKNDTNMKKSIPPAERIVKVSLNIIPFSAAPPVTKSPKKNLLYIVGTAKSNPWKPAPRFRA